MSTAQLTSSRLAIHGGAPVRATKFAPWPCFAEEEIQAACQVLRSGKVNYWTGTEGRGFEEEFARASGCRYAVAVANGSLALELALHAVGIGAGDEVVVTCRSFIASASSVLLRGGTAVFADIDPISQNVTAETIAEAVTTRTRAVIAVHLAGWPCDMDPILRLARERGLKVIEDCAQAHGASYKGRPVGSLGDAAAFSFCQDKILTTGGEGGMLVTNDEGIWRRAWSYKDHGKDHDTVFRRRHPPGFRWLHESFGTNWRLTEMQSAIGRVLLTRLSGWVERRKELAALLNDRFSGIPALRVTIPPDRTFHSYYKYYVFVRPEQLRAGWDRDRVMAAIAAEGIPCGSGSCGEIYLEKAFAASHTGQRLPVAEELARTSLMFLVHPTLTPEDMDDTARAVEKVLEVASR
ncbi:MAG: DegT/DnrJ/EryC1/StrS family aminotransferase [Gemmataceae bacterium]